jgi:hypothetical protein
MDWKTTGLWALRLVPAIILAQTLFFKFTASQESVWIFTQLNAEPWGRIATGVLELLAVILIVVPKTSGYGGVLGVILMLGAIGAHLSKLGVVVQNDGGLLFGMAVVTLALCAALAYAHKEQLAALVA